MSEDLSEIVLDPVTAERTGDGIQVVILKVPTTVRLTMGEALMLRDALDAALVEGEREQ